MDAVIDFLIEGMHEAPIALGALIGFAIAGPCIGVAAWRDHRRHKTWQREYDRKNAEYQRDHDEWRRRHEPKTGTSTQCRATSQPSVIRDAAQQVVWQITKTCDLSAGHDGDHHFPKLTFSVPGYYEDI